jgi:hypothetical protein
MAAQVAPTEFPDRPVGIAETPTHTVLSDPTADPAPANNISGSPVAPLPKIRYPTHINGRPYNGSRYYIKNRVRIRNPNYTYYNSKNHPPLNEKAKAVTINYYTIGRTPSLGNRSTKTQSKKREKFNPFDPSHKLHSILHRTTFKKKVPSSPRKKGGKHTKKLKKRNKTKKIVSN